MRGISYLGDAEIAKRHCRDSAILLVCTRVIAQKLRVFLIRSCSAVDEKRIKR